MTKQEKDIKLLDACIYHWLHMAEGFEEEATDQPSVENCALCTEYHEDGCSDCPIVNYSGEKRCASTPYKRAYELYYGTSRLQWSERESNIYYTACEHMASFLQIVRNDLRVRHEYDKRALVMVDCDIGRIRRLLLRYKEPEIDLNAMLGDVSFKKIRELFRWGAYEKISNTKELKWIRLKDMSKNQLNDIIFKGCCATSWLMSAELDYREYLRLSRRPSCRIK